MASSQKDLASEQLKTFKELNIASGQKVSWFDYILFVIFL